MNQSETGRVEAMISEVEEHFGKKLSPGMRNAFLEFAFQQFASFEAFEKACTLAATHLESYGRFPPFARFLELYQANCEAIRPEYEVLSDRNLLPPAQERGVFDRWTEPVTGNDIERLKAKVVVSEFFKASSWGPRYLQEAIAEAEARGIDLSAIGVTKNADHGESGQPRGFERGDRFLRSRDDSFTAA
jgi:hypothetical protein